MAPLPKPSERAINRSFDPKIVRQARDIAEQFQVILRREGGEYIGRGLEFPNCYKDGKTASVCVRKIREMFGMVIATMLEDGEVPAASRQRTPTEHVNVRLSIGEKLALDAPARRRGYAGLADYIRAAAIAGEKQRALTPSLGAARVSSLQ
jgi:predicted RNase H-like HicB family nuclease